MCLPPHPKGYVALRVEAGSKPSINGKLTDGCWKGAPWSDAFVDIEGPDKPAPRHDTRMKMLWDDECLYIGAWMDEPHPWANLTLHDSIVYHDNDFEVFIDPDGDNHNYYEIEINALGTVWDLFLTRPYRDNGAVLHNWETIAPSEPTQADGPTGWQPLRRAVWVDGRINDGAVVSKGWGVEMAIPWSILGQAAMRRSPPAVGDQWRINFSRVQWRVVWDATTHKYVKDPPDQSEANWVWSPQWEVAMHKPETWGYVQFSSVSTSESAQLAHCGPEKHAVFVQDASWPLRCFLMCGYYAQAKRRRDAGLPYAKTLTELGVEPPAKHDAVRPLVQATEASFIVSAQLPANDGHDTTRFYVNEEGRITWCTVRAGMDA